MSESQQAVLSETHQDFVYALAQIGKDIYAAKASGLYRSTGDGKTWENALASLEPNPIAITDVLEVDGKLFAAATGGIFTSKDGTTWKTVPFRKPSPTLSALAASPDPQNKTLFAASLADGVFRSEDAGETWTAWNMGLFDLHVLSLAAGQDDQVYAGTETGLYQSKNVGRSWEDVDLPFSHDAVLSLLVKENELYVGTENHGMYKLTGGTWEGLEPPPGAVNQMLSLPHNELLVLLSDTVYKFQDTFEAWQGLSGVTRLGVSGENEILLGFSNGEVKGETL